MTTLRQLQNSFTVNVDYGRVMVRAQSAVPDLAWSEAVCNEIKAALESAFDGSYIGGYGVRGRRYPGEGGARRQELSETTPRRR
jgi:hypothetical protein